MSGLIERMMRFIEESRDNLLQGNTNCIPVEDVFPRFSEVFPGIKRGRYYHTVGASKAAKSKFTRFLFMFHPIEYAYQNMINGNEKNIKLKIFLFPLEEQDIAIVEEYTCFLVYKYTNGKVRISPEDLESTKTPVDESILELISSPAIQDRLKFFEEVVTVNKDCNNADQIYFYIKEYATTHGEDIYKEEEYVDKSTGEVKTKKLYDHYEPYDPNEYVIIITDHVGLLEPSKRNPTLKGEIDAHSKYCLQYYRDRWKYIPVDVQQASTEAFNQKAVELGRVMPTRSSMSDTSYIVRNCSTSFGICSPAAYELSEYRKYDITKFGDSMRFVQIIANRHGAPGGTIALYFDGATCTFKELPKANEQGKLEKWYQFVQSLKNKKNGK